MSSGGCLWPRQVVFVRPASILWQRGRTKRHQRQQHRPPLKPNPPTEHCVLGTTVAQDGQDGGAWPFELRNALGFECSETGSVALDPRCLERRTPAADPSTVLRPEHDNRGGRCAGERRDPSAYGRCLVVVECWGLRSILAVSSGEGG